MNPPSHFFVAVSEGCMSKTLPYLPLPFHKAALPSQLLPLDTMLCSR